MVSTLVSGVLSGIGLTPGQPLFTPPTNASAQAPSTAQNDSVLTAGQRNVENYIDFLQLPEQIKTATKKKLLDAEIFDFTLLNEDDIPRKALLDKGLSLGVVGALYRDVSKYRQHLLSVE